MNKIKAGITVSGLAALGTVFGAWQLSQEHLTNESKSSLQGSPQQRPRGPTLPGIPILVTQPLSLGKIAHCASQGDQCINSRNKYIHVNKIYLDSPSRGAQSLPCTQCDSDTYHSSTNDHARITDQSCLSTNAEIANAISSSRTLIQRIMLEQGIPGAQIAVSKNGRLIWSEGIGLADVENSVPCSRDSVMRIASISKPLTSVALLQLWQEGLVDLDAPIQTYVPQFPHKTYGGREVVITARQLLSHLGGIRHYEKQTGQYDDNDNE